MDVAGRWLVELRDRYSWWHKLLPLVMTGLHDEIGETREMAAQLWEKAGLQYMEENISDEKFKDKMDFLTEHPEHYPPNSELYLLMRCNRYTAYMSRSQLEELKYIYHIIFNI